MDGVTDVAMRYMTAKYSGIPVLQYSGGRQESGKTGTLENQTGVDVMFTEFVSVDALHHATGERRERLMKTLMRAKEVSKYSSNPVIQYSSKTLENGSICLATKGAGTLDHIAWPYEIAQVFGKNPELFAEAAELIEKLGFDGIDINMGCPMHKVEDQGSGAGLIRTPKLAQEIIRTVKSATKLPVSVKTRIGVDKDIAEEWMEILMEAKPSVISLHGRTLRQLYSGKADWEAIARAAKVVHQRGGYILGNGDIESVGHARLKIDSYGVDGVLIGRAAEGNPGVFLQSQISNDEFSNWEQVKNQRLAWMVEHARIYEKVFKYYSAPTSEIQENRSTRKLGNDNRWFVPVRKHLAWYCKGFPGAVEMRAKLMLCNSSEEVQAVISSEVERSDLL